MICHLITGQKPGYSATRIYTAKIIIKAMFRERNFMSSKEYMNDYMKRRWQLRRVRAIMFLGTRCETCGSQEDLQFHHKDLSTKEFTLADGSSYSEERFWKEVLKCELQCEPCHEKLTKELGHAFTKKYRRVQVLEAAYPAFNG